MGMQPPLTYLCGLDFEVISSWNISYMLNYALMNKVFCKNKISSEILRTFAILQWEHFVEISNTEGSFGVERIQHQTVFKIPHSITDTVSAV